MRIVVGPQTTPHHSIPSRFFLFFLSKLLASDGLRLPIILELQTYTTVTTLSLSLGLLALALQPQPHQFNFHRIIRLSVLALQPYSFSVTFSV